MTPYTVLKLFTLNWFNIRVLVLCTHPKPHLIYQHQQTVCDKCRCKDEKSEEDGKAETFCFWKIVAVSFWRPCVFLPLSMERQGSSKTLAHKQLIVNMKGMSTLRVFDDVVRGSNTGMIRYLMTFLTMALTKITRTTSNKMSIFFPPLDLCTFILAHKHNNCHPRSAYNYAYWGIVLALQAEYQ